MCVKTCIRCNQEKSCDLFHADRARKDGKARYCKACHKEKVTEWRQKNLARSNELVRRSNRKRAGIVNAQEWETLFDSATHCAICGLEFGNGRVKVLDHDHRTGLGRGILCSQCNTGIGHLGDDIDRLRAAIKYLEDSEHGV